MWFICKFYYYYKKIQVANIISLFHVLITLAIDSTIALPEEYQLGFQKYLAQVHLDQNKDLLVASRPKWLQGFVWVELLFQTPFFIGAAIGLTKDCKKTYLWILLYCVEAAITTFGCLVEVVYLDGLTQNEKLNLFFVYLPTCLVPLAMGYDFWKRVSKWVPTSTTTKNKRE